MSVLHLHCLLAAFLWSVCGLASAIDPRLTLNQLHHTAWTAREGAPVAAWGIAQTADGVVWVGSQQGLFRFDGLRFERLMTPGADGKPLGAIMTLHADGPDLWIGMLYGQGIYQLSADGRLVSRNEGIDTKWLVSGFGSDHAGGLWAATHDGPYHYAGGRWQAKGEALGHPTARLKSILQDRHGGLWTAGSQGVFHRPAGSARFRSVYAESQGGFFRTASDGSVWFSGATYEVFSASRAAAAPTEPRIGLHYDKGIGSLHVDRDDSLWFAASGGIFRVPSVSEVSRVRPNNFPADIQRFGKDHGLSGDWAHLMFEDRDGNLWVTTNGGVDRFRAPAVVRHRNGNIGYSGFVPAAGGGLLLVNEIVGMAFVDGDDRKPTRDVPLDSGSYILEEAGGVRWVGANGGLWRFDDGARQPVPVPLPPEVRSGSLVLRLIRHDDGALWMSLGSRGLFALKDGVWSRKDMPGVDRRGPLAMAHDRERRLWLGYSKDTIITVDGPKVRALGAAEGLQITNVHWLGEVAGRMVVAGTDGVAWWDGQRFQPLLGEGGERFEGTLALLVEPDEAVWLSTGQGIVRIDLAQWQRALGDPQHRMAFRGFDHLDGLLTPATDPYPVQRIARGTDGRLWFSSASGLYRLDPRRLPRNPTPPTVMLRSVVADGRTQAPGTQLRLPAGTKRVDFGFTAFGLSIPERGRFRYRLDGSDTGWQEAGTQREAHYMNLGPGEYRFRVIAANEDGVWNEAGAGIGFSIPPLLHQTLGFKALCAAAAGLLLWLLYRLRLRKMGERLRAQIETRQQERERIARDLHDTLLQSTHGLLLQVQSLADRTPVDHPDKPRLERVLARADQALRESRRKVLELRADVDDDVDLENWLRDLACELSERGPAAVTVRVQGVARSLRQSTRAELLSVGREAMLNAQKHARASTIELLLSYEADVLRLRVSDDGQGMAEALMLGSQATPGHWGLAGMRERAAVMGAALTIHRDDGQRTAVELIVPAALAYV
jgi:signal transduction histidine kinase/ligand-binding sensor domain-containing protein